MQVVAERGKGWVSLIDLLHSGVSSCIPVFENIWKKSMFGMGRISEEQHEEYLESEAFVSCDEELQNEQPRGIVRLKQQSQFLF